MRIVANSWSEMGPMGAFSFSPSTAESGGPESADSSDQLNGCRSMMAIRSDGGDAVGHGRTCGVSALAGGAMVRERVAMVTGLREDERLRMTLFKTARGQSSPVSHRRWRSILFRVIIF